MKKRLICCVLALVVTFAQVVSVGATREEQLRVEQETTNNSLNEAYATIESLEVQKEALSMEINELDQELVNVMVTVNVLKKDIAKKETAIKETKEDLKEAQEKKDEQYEAMKKRIQFLYEKGGGSAWLQVLFESKDLPDLLNKAEYTQKMYEYDRDNLQKFEDTVEGVKALGVQLEAEKAELVDMKGQQEAQQASLESQLASENYEAQIATAQSQAEEYASLLQQQTEEIARLEAERLAAEEEARRQAEAAAAAEEAARKAEEARLAQEAEKEARRQAAAAAEAEEAAQAETGEELAEEVDMTEDVENIADLGSEDIEDDDTEINGITGDTTVEDSTDSSPVTDDGSDTTDTVQTDEYGNVIDESSSGTGSVTTPAVSTGSGAGQEVVNYALQFVGNPYVWGGTDPVNGADCSGFVQSVYAHFGVALNRTSEAQMANGVSVPYSQAQPGDLICYGSHIAIYMGNGQIVHASNSAPYPAGGIKVSDNAAYRTILDVRRVI